MPGLSRRLQCSCKSVGKNLALPRRAIARQRLEYHVVAALGVGRPIPRSMEGDEYTMTVVRRELPLVVQRHRVRRPMRRKGRDRGGLGRARTRRLAAVAAVLRSEDQFSL